MDKNMLFCPCCREEKREISFYLMQGAKKKFLPLCRDCVENITKKAIEQYGSLEAGFWAGAMVSNVPAIKEVIEEAVSRCEYGAAKSFFTYYSTLKDYGQIYENGILDSDVCLSDYYNPTQNTETKEIEEVEVDLVEMYAEEIKTWGKFTTPDGEIDEEAYEFLEDIYEKYTSEILEMNTALELTYRDLCIAHWQKRKADEAGEYGDADKAKKQINNALALLKLDKFTNNSLSEEEKHIEHLIWEIENTTPAECEDLNKYKDFSKFEKPFEEIMRCVKNLVAGTKEYPEISKDNM